MILFFVYRIVRILCCQNLLFVFLQTFLEHVKRQFGPRDYNGVPFEKITPTVGLNSESNDMFEWHHLWYIYHVMSCDTPPHTHLLTSVGHVNLAGVQVVMWDLGGQEDLRTLWDKVSNLDPIEIHCVLSCLMYEVVFCHPCSTTWSVMVWSMLLILRMIVIWIHQKLYLVS